MLDLNRFKNDFKVTKNHIYIYNMGITYFIWFLSKSTHLIIANYLGI